MGNAVSHGQGRIKIIKHKKALRDASLRYGGTNSWNRKKINLFTSDFPYTALENKVH